jgi:hypothetical protein
LSTTAGAATSPPWWWHLAVLVMLDPHPWDHVEGICKGQGLALEGVIGNLECV